jgi:hypothetical protein
MGTSMRKNIVRNMRYDDDAGGYLWAVFPRRYSDDRIRQFFRMHGIWSVGHYQRTGNHVESMDDCERYGGVGQHFTLGMSFYRKGSRVLVTQRWGYDI